MEEIIFTHKNINKWKISNNSFDVVEGSSVSITKFRWKGRGKKDIAKSPKDSWNGSMQLRKCGLLECCNFCVNTGLTGWLGPCPNLSSQITMNVRLHNTAGNPFTPQPFKVCWKNLGITITRGSRHRISPIRNINMRELECLHVFGTRCSGLQKLINKSCLFHQRPVKFGSAKWAVLQAAGSCIRLPQNQSWYK